MTELMWHLHFTSEILYISDYFMVYILQLSVNGISTTQ